MTRAAEVSAEGRVGKPRVLRLDAVLERLLPTLLEAEGADSLSPGDGFVALELEVQAQGSLDALKALPDSWGEADPYLAVDRGLQALTRFRLDRETAPVLVTLPSLDPLRARLVERDVSIADGITEEDLARIEARLRGINAFAPIQRCTRGTVSVESVLDVRGFDLQRALQVHPQS